MSFLEEVKALKTTPRDLRKFGLVVGGVFLLLGGWFLYRQKPYAWTCLVPGSLLMLLGLVAPRILRTVYVVWMTVGFALGTVVSAIILTVLFYLILTPVGLVAKLAGKDFLSLKLAPESGTYWVSREQRKKTPADYEKQF